MHSAHTPLYMCMEMALQPILGWIWIYGWKVIRCVRVTDSIASTACVESIEYINTFSVHFSCVVDLTVNVSVSVSM